MKRPAFNIIGLGELLWDMFPEGKQLGGAPANFAYITSLLGDCGIVASRIGKDTLGEEACRRLAKLRLQTSFVQSDEAHPTGTVQVQVDAQGQPSFVITEDIAWDFMAWTPEWEALAEKADAVCFGSLAQRSAISRATIHKFLAAAKTKATLVFDVNLRQHFFSREILENSVQLADVIKLNHEELPRVAQLLGAPPAEEIISAQWLRHKYDLKLVCVTRGAKGSLLVNEKYFHEHPGFRAIVADTVGAGDAFTAGLIHHFLRGAPLAAMNEAANRLGAWVASQRGATPAPEDAQLKRVRA
jgi:fructokinase